MLDTKGSLENKQIEKKNSQASFKMETNNKPVDKDNLENPGPQGEKIAEKKTAEEVKTPKGGFEKCDGCLKPLGFIYCVSCEKNFCKECDTHAHTLPAYTKHERIPLDELAHVRKMCVNHKQPLKFYCESCNDPICSECYEKGSHSNKLHKISNIVDSFRKKYSYLNNIVTQNLLQKNEQLIDQMQLIERISEEVRNNKLEIEREIKKEYVKIMENLKNEEGKKLSVLQYESSVLQKEVDRIADFVSYFKELGNSNPDMIGFLLIYKKLSENIENCFAKPIKKNIDIKVDDFPHEIEDRNNRLILYEKAKKLLQIKDDIIWNLIMDKKERYEHEVVIEREKQKNEISELNRVIEKLCGDMKKYELVCHFCSVRLEETTINTGCHRNIPESTSRSYNTGVMKEYYTSCQIPLECVGNKRHFFGPPNRPLNNNGSQNQMFSSTGLGQFSYNYSSPKRDLNSSGYTTGRNNRSGMEETSIMSIVEKMKTIASNKQSTVLDFFRQVYRESDIVPFDNIKSFLKKTFSLEDSEIKVFLSNFKANGLLPSSVQNSFSLANSQSYQIQEIFNFIKSKQLGSKFVDSKINKFENSGLVFADRISEWIYKVASLVERNGINLFGRLCAEDRDEDGFISTDDLRISFTKLKLNINTNDIEAMINYFGYLENQKVDIGQFSKNFMAHLNENPQSLMN